MEWAFIRSAPWRKPVRRAVWSVRIARLGSISSLSSPSEITTRRSKRMYEDLDQLLSAVGVIPVVTVARRACGARSPGSAPRRWPVVRRDHPFRSAAQPPSHSGHIRHEVPEMLLAGTKRSLREAADRRCAAGARCDRGARLQRVPSSSSVSIAASRSCRASRRRRSSKWPSGTARDWSSSSRRSRLAGSLPSGSGGALSERPVCPDRRHQSGEPGASRHSRMWPRSVAIWLARPGKPSRTATSRASAHVRQRRWQSSARFDPSSEPAGDCDVTIAQ